MKHCFMQTSSTELRAVCEQEQQGTAFRRESTCSPLLRLCICWMHVSVSTPGWLGSFGETMRISQRDARSKLIDGEGLRFMETGGVRTPPFYFSDGVSFKAYAYLHAAPEGSVTLSASAVCVHATFSVEPSNSIFAMGIEAPS